MESYQEYFDITDDGMVQLIQDFGAEEIYYVVEGIELDQRDMTIEEQMVIPLYATVLPRNAVNQNITWSSSDETVATVSQEGVVTAISAGNAIITVETQSRGFTATCEVEVYEYVTRKDFEILDMSLSQDTVGPGDSFTLNVSFRNNYAYAATVPVSIRYDEASYITEDITFDGTEAQIIEKTYTIDAGQTEGYKTIAVRINWESMHEEQNIENNAKALAIMVTDAGILPTGITLSQSTATISVEDTLALTATVLPDDATDKTVTWSSSDNSVATVDSDGIVTGVSVGTTTITAKTFNELTAICEITVATEPESVTISIENGNSYQLSDNGYYDLRLYGGAGFYGPLTATVYPAGAIQEVYWESDNPDAISIDEDGVLEVFEVLVYATITAKSKANDEIFATFIVFSDSPEEEQAPH